MTDTVSLFRLYLMRALYLLNFALLGSDVWPVLISHNGPWDPVKGVAFAFWGALSLVSGLGIRYPLQMVPVLILQFVYKAVWLIAVLLPLRAAGQTTDLTFAFVLGIILDVIVIPWPYVWSNYILKTGDRWRRAS